MNCSHCRQPIGRDEAFGRLDAGVTLDHGRVTIPHDVNLHDRCEGSWWLKHHPHLVKVRERALEMS